MNGPFLDQIFHFIMGSSYRRTAGEDGSHSQGAVSPLEDCNCTENAVYHAMKVGKINLEWHSQGLSG